MGLSATSAMVTIRLPRCGNSSRRRTTGLKRQKEKISVVLVASVGPSSLILTISGVGSGVGYRKTASTRRGFCSNKRRNHSVLHYLLCRLYDEGRGQLVNARLTLAQTTLSKKLGISRQWVGELVSRLKRAGWLEPSSPKLLDGTDGSSVWRVGRMLKRLLVMLGKSRRGDKRGNTPAKSTWHFSPLRREKAILSLLSKEQELPHPRLLEKIPLLGQRLTRGKKRAEGEDDSLPPFPPRDRGPGHNQ